MLLATNLTLLEWLLLGALVAFGGWMLWRGFSRTQLSTTPSGETEESERAQARAEGRIAHLEVRLHDFAREVEARMETRALRLDSLVVASDREIVRLSALLDQLSGSIGTRQPDVTFDPPPSGAARGSVATTVPPPNASPVSPAQTEMVGHLNEAGYSVTEIAHIVGHPPEIVRALLKKAA